MGASYEIIIIEREDWIGGIEELGMEDDFDSVGRVIEELHPADLIQYRILRVIGHIVGDYRWKTVSLHGV